MTDHADDADEPDLLLDDPRVQLLFAGFSIYFATIPLWTYLGFRFPSLMYRIVGASLSRPLQAFVGWSPDPTLFFVLGGTVMFLNVFLIRYAPDPETADGLDEWERENL